MRDVVSSPFVPAWPACPVAAVTPSSARASVLAHTLCTRPHHTQAFLGAHFGYRQALLSSQLRSAVTAAVFRKAVAVNAATLAGAGSGRVQVRAGGSSRGAREERCLAPPCPAPAAAVEHGTSTAQALAAPCRR